MFGLKPVEKTITFQRLNFEIRLIMSAIDAIPAAWPEDKREIYDESKNSKNIVCLAYGRFIFRCNGVER